MRAYTYTAGRYFVEIDIILAPDMCLQVRACGGRLSVEEFGGGGGDGMGGSWAIAEGQTLF